MSTTIMTVVLLMWTGKPGETAWNSNYAEALKYARIQDKPLFIVFDSRSSELGLTVRSGFFGGDRIERVLEEDYVRMFVDVETDSGHSLASEFGATEFPRIVILDRTGEWQVYRRSGDYTPDELESVVIRHRRAKFASSTSSGTTIGTTTASSTTSTHATGSPTAASTCKT